MIDRAYGPPPERWLWVDRFIRGLDTLTPPEKRQVRWTPEEWAHLMFLRWLHERRCLS